MAKNPTHQVCVRLKASNGGWLADASLRPMLVQDAQTHGVSLNERVVKILSDVYGVPFETTQRKSEPKPDADLIHVHLPVKLWKVIEGRTRRPLSVPDAIRGTLSQHYGLRVPPKPLRSRVAA